MQKSLFVWRYNALKQIQRANYEYQQKMSEWVCVRLFIYIHVYTRAQVKR